MDLAERVAKLENKIAILENPQLREKSESLVKKKMVIPPIHQNGGEDLLKEAREEIIYLLNKYGDG